MSKIFVIMGKSASGKDTIFKRLIQDKKLDLKIVVPYTTRPIREGEMEGVEYHFVDDARLYELKKQNKVIEHRAYETIHGLWNYFTVDDEQIDLIHENYLMIGTLESFLQMKEYYGEDKVVPIYIDLEDGIRLERALEREKLQKEPKYIEMCRRFLADDKDFSKKRLDEAKVNQHFSNISMEQCLQDIINYINTVLRND
ncbi:nucleoside/nucleotide kinase family protein [Anaeromicropila herbilytica]|uniref:Guanylate kinase n=1 Tax=Anaeromicropila herbilytica TaxID=2785025 RepID=A0A7R7IAR1_9FIRM|nr:guanylate kinase [Anaeromicropila herbilytica]BCN28728.1 guanylate kinase [Anaeromicropila herbilytica]